MTPARIAANRVRSWRHGKRSKVVSELEGRMAQLRKIDPKLPEILEACIAAIAGDLDPYQKLGISALFEAEAIRQASVDEIAKRGLIIEEKVWGGDGAQLGTKLKANPLLDNTRRLYDTLGFTADLPVDTNQLSTARAVSGVRSGRTLRDSALPSPPAYSGGGYHRTRYPEDTAGQIYSGFRPPPAAHHAAAL